MKKLAIMDEDIVPSATNEQSANSSANVTPRSQKKFDSGAAKRHRWKNWGWKHSPAKSSSIEEEPSQSESPKRSQSSKSSTPNQSPKHKFKAPDGIANGIIDDASTAIRRKKLQTSEIIAKDRSSAGARLIQLLDNNGLDKLDSDEFRALLPENGRPASIHIIQSISRDDF